MKDNKNIIDEIEKWIDRYLNENEKKYESNPAAMDKINHIKRVVALTKKIAPDNRMAILAAKAHDIGRFSQLELLGSFNDGKVLHHNLRRRYNNKSCF